MFITFCAVAGGAQAGNWDLGASYNAQILSNVAGGIARGTRYLDKLTVAAAWNSPRTEGLQLLASLQYVNGVQFSGSLVGDLQTVSNIEAPRGVRLYDAAVQWTAPGDDAYVRFGLTDLNAYFDIQGPGALFLNSSNGIGPDFSQTGQNGPSIFPTTALALLGDVAVGGGWRAQAAVFDAIAGNPARPGQFVAVKGGGGALLVGELDYALPGGALTVEFGGWAYTAPFPALAQTRPDGTPAEVGGNAGAYAIVQARLWGDSGRSVNGWLRFGGASSRINPIGRYLGGGIVASGVVPRRPDDQFGVAVMRAVYGDVARAATPGLEAAETAIELTWFAEVGGRFGIQPDLQHVINPSGDPALGNALVLGVSLLVEIEN